MKKKNPAKIALRRAWNELSLKLRKEHSVCQKCGKPHSRLNVHHLLPRRLYPQLLLDERNLIVLCPACHQFSHGSAHLDGLAFSVWLFEQFPEKIEYLKRFMK